MLPLTKERALQLMERDVTVYMLYTDNTEAMAFDANELMSHDGIFGVELSEWETVKDRFAVEMPDYEKAFLENPADSFAIYQLKRSDETTELRFMGTEYLDKKGLSADRDNYDVVYAADLMYSGDTDDRLNGLYQTFNINHPDDFRGHSMSVSDIVALKQDGMVPIDAALQSAMKAPTISWTKPFLMPAFIVSSIMNETTPKKILEIYSVSKKRR